MRQVKESAVEESSVTGEKAVAVAPKRGRKICDPAESEDRNRHSAAVPIIDNGGGNSRLKDDSDVLAARNKQLSGKGN